MNFFALHNFGCGCYFFVGRVGAGAKHYLVNFDVFHVAYSNYVSWAVWRRCKRLQLAEVKVYNFVIFCVIISF